MTAEKYSASMDDALLTQARAAAQADGLTLSGWLAEAASDQLRLRCLRTLVTEWEAEQGAITDQEIEALDRKVAVARGRARRTRGRTAS